MSDLFQQTLAHFSSFVELRAFLGVVISFFQSAAFQVVIGEETARDGKCERVEKRIAVERQSSY